MYEQAYSTENDGFHCADPCSVLRKIYLYEIYLLEDRGTKCDDCEDDGRDSDGDQSEEFAIGNHCGSPENKFERKMIKRWGRSPGSGRQLNFTRRF
jgi:hypothetical protein